MKASTFLAVAVITSLLDASCAYSDLVVDPLNTFREVSTRAFGGSMASDDLDFGPAAGPYSYMSASTDNGPAGDFLASATQTSNAPAGGPTMEGTGAAGALINVLGAGGYAGATSFFQAKFTVNSPAQYLFNAAVTYEADNPPFDFGFANVALFDYGTFTELAFIEQSDLAPGSDSVSLLVSLSPGVEYEIGAGAQIGDLDDNLDTLGAHTASASWSFSLTPVAVPEVGSMLLMTPPAVIVMVWSCLVSRRARGATR
jgi:hypothetical protein